MIDEQTAPSAAGPSPVFVPTLSTDQVRALLVLRFPNCFMPKGKEKLPLKIGIHRDLFAALPGIPRNRIRIALASYTGGPTYLRNMLAGFDRVDLDGMPAGTITPEHAHWHLRRLIALQKKWQRRASPIERKSGGDAQTRIGGKDATRAA